MVHQITLDAHGHKVARRINNRSEYFEVRNTDANHRNFIAARGGDQQAKRQLVQFNYNDTLPDGVLKGCCHTASTFAHDIDCGNEEECKRVAQKLIEQKDAIGLLEVTLSPNWGVHAVCRRQQGKTILENQVRLSTLTETEMDTSAHDQQRVMFTGPADEDTLLFLDDAIFEEPLTVEESAKEFELLKQREREGREELPAGAKKANKHYRPWDSLSPKLGDDRGLNDETENSLNNACSDPQPPNLGGKYPTQYHGIPFEDIRKKYWELHNGGFEPVEGDRDTLTFQMARDFRHICGKDEEWLDQVIPCYDGFPEAEKRAKIHSALQCSDFGMPSRMQAVLDELKKNAQCPTSESDAKSAEPVWYFNPQRLPIGLRESLKGKPQNMLMPLLVGQMPILMTLADGVEVRYCDGRLQHLAGMAIILGEQANNKTAVKDVVEPWMAGIRRADQAAREREEQWREQNKGRKANERAQTNPKVLIREVPITISCSTLLKRLKQSQGHALFSFCEEMDTLHKTNGAGAWSAKYDIYRNAFDHGQWGQDFNSDQAESGMVEVAYNWVCLSTLGVVQKCFRAENVENGLSSRMMLGEMPGAMFEKLTVFSPLSSAELERIEQAANKLQSQHGFVDTPKLRKAIGNWVEGKRQQAARSMDRVMDVYRKRAAVIGFRCGVVFMLLEGKESKACLDFACLMAEYTLHMQMKYFGAALMSQYEKTSSGSQRYSGNKNIFEQLPQTFIMKDVKALKGSEYSDGTLYSIISRWMKDGWIEKTGKNSWTKTNSNRPSTNV
ncbi:MAG: hypothetical protein K6D61_05815 [Prevotella sp.]|nr:hypothetical protein [Prevotella sp.]